MFCVNKRTTFRNILKIKKSNIKLNELRIKLEINLNPSETLVHTKGCKPLGRKQGPTNYRVAEIKLG